MSISRLGGAFSAPILHSEPDPARSSVPAGLPDMVPLEQQPGLGPQLHRHGPRPKRRAASRKRRDSDNPHAADPGGESEDLLMMLEQHLRHDEDAVRKIGPRDARDDRSSSHQQEHGADAERKTGQLATGDGRERAGRPMRLVQRPVRDESSLLKQWRAAAKGGARTPLLRAEQALMALPAASRQAAAANAARAAQLRTDGAGSRPAQPSPTYSILAIVREFLTLPEGERTSGGTLASVRDRLLAASSNAARGQGLPARAVTAAEESVNLLLPIVLLNLARGRTRAGRANGISSLAALIRRGRGW